MGRRFIIEEVEEASGEGCFAVIFKFLFLLFILHLIVTNLK